MLNFKKRSRRSFTMTRKSHKPLALILISVLALTLTLTFTADITVYAENEPK